jgi:hypothetical protein
MSNDIEAEYQSELAEIETETAHSKLIKMKHGFGQNAGSHDCMSSTSLS